MIQEFIDRFILNKEKLAGVFTEKHPDDYMNLVVETIRLITDKEEYGIFNPSPNRIHQIDDGDYQGTLLFVIAAKGYQPSKYWYVKVNYGSCSGCDTLQSIRMYGDEKPTPEQIKDYLTLALHIVEGLKEMN